jgi:hypothetical protein
MKQFMTAVILVVMILIGYKDAKSQIPDKQKRVPGPIEMLNNSAQGREFWIAIPPNEIPSHTPNVLEIYITSAKRTMVRLYNPYTGLLLNKIVEPMQITTFSTAAGEIGWDLEVRESEQITGKGLQIEAEQPISVYVLNGKSYSSDGYLALPVTALGKEYYSLCYFDFKEWRDWGSGFLIIAIEDQTKVTIRLNGRGKGMAHTVMGRDIGDVIRVNLQQGQTYMVRGDATSRGVFDLSGSFIKSNKPVGFISFHMRTMTPVFNVSGGRDHLCEMLPPVHAWGKKYITVEYKRDKEQGDLFRIMASEDNTHFRCTYYDKNDGTVLGNWEGILKHAGDFEDYLEVFTPSSGNKLKSIRGTSVWTADKPVLLHQYSYSSAWDGNPVFDPFMIIVVPEEQFIPNTVFQTPANKAFVTNWFNIVATHDTNDLEFKDLKSIKIDGIPITQMEPRFTYNKIPTTNMYWAKVPMQPGPHRIYGDGKVRFGGYIYGFSSYDSYGWPAAMAINKLDELDTLPPVLNKVGDCGNYVVDATELRDGAPDDNPRQVDQGIVNIELLDSLNGSKTRNYELYITEPNPFKTYPPVYKAQFVLNVIDKSQDAFAVYSVTDKYGNFTIDSVSYEADKITITPKEINFGNVRLNTTKTITAKLKNEGDSTVLIKEIRLQNASVFKIINGGAPPEFFLQPQEVRDIEIAYTPKDESPDEKIRDKDSIEVITECDTAAWYIHGRGVIPKILVEDWDAGAVIVGNKVCKEGQTGFGLKISNTGTDTLIISGIRDVAAPFSLSVPYTPAPPFTIPPKSDIWLVTPCFTSNDINSHTIDVTFGNNAGEGDSISNWKGRGIEAGPYVTPWDYGSIRVNSVREGTVYVRNSGNAAVKITGVRLRNNIVCYKILSVIPTPSVGSPIDLQPETSDNGIKEIVVKVQYNPQTEGATTDDVVAIFDPSEHIDDGTIFNWVKGNAYLPKIVLVGYEFTSPIVSGTTHPTTGEVTIHSTSSTADLYVQEIRWKNAGQQEFEFQTPPPSDFTIPMGDSIKIPVIFHPTTVGRIVEPVEVVNDAAPAIDSIIVTEADVIGYAYLNGVEATDINYGNVITCNQPVLHTTVTNTGSGDIVIDSLQLLSGDTTNFSVVNATFPIDLPSGESRDIDIQFSPDRLGPFMAQIIVHTNIDEDPIITVQGRGYEAHLALSMDKYDANDKLAPGYRIKPNIYMDLDLPADAEITKIQFDIVYNTSWMKYADVTNKGNVFGNDWTITATETSIDATQSKLTITMEGTNPITAQRGVLVIPEFIIMLSDNKDFVPAFENITTETRDDCVVRTSTPGYVILNTCVIDLRGVIATSTQYELYDVDPNPISGPNVNVKYSISFAGQTKLELFKSSGELVGVLVNGEVKAGVHELTVPTASLNSGVYYLRLSSAQFTETKPMVIAK